MKLFEYETFDSKARKSSNPSTKITNNRQKILISINNNNIQLTEFPMIALSFIPPISSPASFQSVAPPEDALLRIIAANNARKRGTPRRRANTASARGERQKKN